MDKIYLVDTVGPFFPDEYEDSVVNWSKTHFSQLESGQRLSADVRKRIERRFLKYIKRVGALGYNSISIDDLAHLTILPWYGTEHSRLLRDYRLLYRQLFKIAGQHGMKIFVNTDYLFFNQDIDTYLRQTKTGPSDFFKQVLSQVFQNFPEVNGIVMRLGETDGKDVRGTFISRLTIKTPRQLNKLLGEVLPIFEAANKLLIVRTWTVGVYKIGDLIWNQKTYDAAFGSIKSSALITSMKFGDTDFTRYLQLNPLLLSRQHNKIIELQTRREWEGMGLFPSFVGWDYASYLQQLKGNASVVGIHVWCQTGGWAKRTWTNITYLQNSSFWNELNTEVTISIARHNTTVEEAVAVFCKARNIKEVNQFIELLRLSETAIKKGVYIPDLARKTLYFRRTRIPPLLWLTWDKALLSPAAIIAYRSLLPAENTVIKDADEALKAAENMVGIARKIKLNKKVTDSLIFETATLRIFRDIKRYILGDLAVDALQKSINSYHQSYPQHYSIPQLKRNSKVRRTHKWMAKLILRETAPYRAFDKVILGTSPIQLVIARLILRLSKSRLASQAMGIDVLFK